MDDKEFFAQARVFKKHHDAEKTGEREKKVIAEPLMAELRRRKIKSVTSTGRSPIRVTIVTQMRKVASVTKAKKVLKPKVYKRVVVEAIDMNALEYEYSQGNISDKELAKIVKNEPKSSYLSVVPVEVNQGDA